MILPTTIVSMYVIVTSIKLAAITRKRFSTYLKVSRANSTPEATAKIQTMRLRMRARARRAFKRRVGTRQVLEKDKAVFGAGPFAHVCLP